MEVLRSGVLNGVTVLHAGGGAGPAARCAALGATTHALGADLLDEDATAAAIAALPRPDLLLCDAATPFTGGLDGMRVAVDGAFNALRATVNAHWSGDEPGGRAVLLAPAAGERATAVRAALENLARTVSIEWARFGITTTAILPGTGTGTGAEVAELVAFLASPAGGYYSGCAFSMR